jgi:hypothetical protein
VSKEKKYPDLERAIKDALALAKTFEEKVKGIDVAMKFEVLKLKSRGPKFGQGFDNPGGDEDDDDLE